MLRSVPPARSLDLQVTLLYGIGELPVTMTMVLTGLFLLYFYNTVLGLPAVWVGVGVAAGLVVDAVSDPYIGFRSDVSRHPLGRRHVFMLAGSLTMGVCFFLLFSPPAGLRGPALFSWLFVSSVAFRTASAVYRIPYLTLGAELTDDYHERTRVIGIRALFGLGGTLFAAVLSFLIFFPSVTAGVDPKLVHSNYRNMGLAVGGLMTASGISACYGTRAHRRPGTGDSSVRWSKFFADFGTTMRSHTFRHLWISCTLFFLAVVLNASLSLQFFTWAARIIDSGLISRIQGSFYAGAIAGVGALMFLSRRGEKRTLFIGSTLLVAAILMAAPFTIGAGRLLGQGNAFPLAAGYCAAGIFASAVWVLPSSMVADATDEDEKDTGERREGLFFGVMNFGEKIGAGGALLLSGILLHQFVRLVPAAVSQSPDATFRLGIAYGVIPGLILIAAAAAMVPYRLTAASVASIQETLRLRRNSVKNA